MFRKVVAKEYASRSDEDLNLFASEAALELNSEIFGDLYPRCLCLLTAHLIFVSERSAELTGVMESAKAGNVENKWKVAETNHDYSLSKYGQEYLRLRKQVVTTLSNAGSDIPAAALLGDEYSL